MFLMRSSMFRGFLFSFCFCLSQQLLAETPRLTLVEDSYDFGQVLEGSVVEHTFEIENSGDADLRIEKVVSGCNCLAGDYADTLVLPTEKTQISLKLDTNGLSGRFDKKIRFFTNEEDRNFGSFTLTGYVVPLVKIEPNVLNFADVISSDDLLESKLVKITLNPSYAGTILALKSYSKAIQVEEVSVSQLEKTYEIKLVGKLQLGDYRNRVVLSLSDGKNINIPVTAVVYSMFELEPRILSLGSVAETDAVIKKTVAIKNRSQGRYRVTDVDTSSSFIKAEIKENAGEQFLEVFVDPQDIKRSFNERITLETDYDNQESVVLSVHAFKKK